MQKKQRTQTDDYGIGLLKNVRSAAAAAAACVGMADVVEQQQRRRKP